MWKLMFASALQNYSQVPRTLPALGCGTWYTLFNQLSKANLGHFAA
jgi:hypothetical protein